MRLKKRSGQERKYSIKLLIRTPHPRENEIREISKILKAENMLLWDRNIDSDTVYEINEYIDHPELNVCCLIDRNILSYLVSMIKGFELSEKNAKPYRLTAGLQAFFCFCNIITDAGMALLEGRDLKSIDYADEEYSFFRSADNYDAEIWLDIAQGKRNSVDSKRVLTFPKNEFSKSGQPKEVRQVNINIVIIKKALLLLHQTKNNVLAMLELIKWIEENYLFSAPAFFFMIIYCSDTPVSKMIKGRSEKAIRNATWDVALLQDWYRRIEKDAGKTTWLLATNDKAIKETARLLFVRNDEQNNIKKYFSRIEKHMMKYWGKNKKYGKEIIECFKNYQEKDKNHPVFTANAYHQKIRENIHLEYDSVFNQ